MRRTGRLSRTKSARRTPRLFANPLGLERLEHRLPLSHAPASLVGDSVLDGPALRGAEFQQSSVAATSFFGPMNPAAGPMMPVALIVDVSPVAQGNFNAAPSPALTAFAFGSSSPFDAARVDTAHGDYGAMSSMDVMSRSSSMNISSGALFVGDLIRPIGVVWISFNSVPQTPSDRSVIATKEFSPVAPYVTFPDHIDLGGPDHGIYGDDHGGHEKLPAIGVSIDIGPRTIVFPLPGSAALASAADARGSEHVAPDGGAAARAILPLHSTLLGVAPDGLLPGQHPNSVLMPNGEGNPNRGGGNDATDDSIVASEPGMEREARAERISQVGLADHQRVATATEALANPETAPELVGERATLLGGLALSTEALDQALASVAGEIEQFGGELISWFDEANLNSWTVSSSVAIAVGAGAAYAWHASARRRAKRDAEEESSTWLFTRLHTPAGQ